MILQCDQCNTKFRLDDSKLKPGGVKVRCSKCRHVFVAGAEFRQEESEFDALLSGLGAPAAEPREEAPAAGAGLDISGFAPEQKPAGATAPTASSAPAEPAVPAEFAALADFSAPAASVEPAAPAEPATTAGPAEPGAPAEPAAPFEFAETPHLTAPEPETAGGATGTSQPELSDFADLDFSTEQFEPATAGPLPQDSVGFSALEFATDSQQPESQAPAAPASGLEYGEFSFDEEPAPLAEEPVHDAKEPFDFSEFSFSEEPLITPETPAGTHPSEPGLQFGEFEFEEEPAVKEPAAAAAAGEGLEFGEFSFSEEPSVPGEQGLSAEAPQPQTTSGGEFDFGAFSFSEEPPPLDDQPAPATAQEGDFAEFSFSEEPAQLQEEPSPAAGQGFDFGEFSFEKEPPAAAVSATPIPAAKAEDAEAAPAAGSFSFGEALHAGKAEAQPGEEADFSFGEFSLDQPAVAEPAEPAAAPEAAAPVQAQAPTQTKEEGPLPFAPGSKEAAPAAAGAPLDFDLGQIKVPERVPDDFQIEDEELPPLSISSRRKGRSVMAVSVIAVSVLVIVALSGAGFYLMQSGPAAFDKLGLGFVAKWVGMEGAEDGKIVIRNQQASFYQNKEAGELFVVSGEAVNTYRKARASIHVKVTLFDGKGAPLVSKTAYCGNRLSGDQLTTLPLSKIESIMNNQFGDSLSNLGVPPNKAIGFVVAIPNVPKDAADFGVEVVGSTVAGK